MGNGDGSFGAPTTYAILPNFFHGLGSVTAADLNGDGKLDLAASMNGGVGVLLGTGDGTFGARTDLVCDGNDHDPLAISGIFDLEPIALTYINDRLRLDADEVATLSPARLLRHGMAPLALAVGSDELAELKRQSASFKDLADTLELPMTLQVLPGHQHFSMLEELASADGALTHELLRLVAREPPGGHGPA